MFLSLFAMNQRYGWLRCMKALTIIRKKMVISVVHSIDTFFCRKAKKSVVSVLSAESRDFHVFEACPKTG